MSVTVKPLSDSLGAEITGIDLRDALDAETVAFLMTAWHAHLVLLFRDQQIDEEQQIRFARHFGALQERPRPKAMRADGSLNKYPDLTMLISNIRQDGKLIGSLPDGEMQFHSDMCFVEKPPTATMLYAIEVPSRGGDTVFANMYAVYEALPPDLKREIERRRALNVYLYGAANRESHKPDLAVNPNHLHPMVRTHPDTGRDVLYVNRLMSWGIEGLADGPAMDLLDRLFDVIEQPQFHYAHKWRPGDLVVWDNRCTQHARTDFSNAERRLLRRVAVRGDDIPFNRHLGPSLAVA